MTASLNGDLSVRISVDTARMPWTASPSGSVWRKRVHRVGPPESGQVTSVVRYDPDARFPAHDHPDGEEILVLDGVFSDEHGDWPAGTYLLNPEGFRHTPFSRPGCVLFVKLRQYPGRDRTHVAITTDELSWTSTATPGVVEKRLYAQEAYSDSVRLERWDADTDRGNVTYGGGVEIFVIDGEFRDAADVYRSGSWLRLPVGTRHRAFSEPGCTLYIKESGLAYLNSG